MTPREILKKYFGYDGFRAGQEEIISQIQAKNDVLAVMPTGAGKSLCYQIPALLFPGLTIVISPLISLMKDQVDALQEYGISCAFLNSSLGETEYRAVMRAAAYGQFKLLYIAPERLEAPGFSQMVQTLPVSMVAVDEAHCVSQWGHDFRPSYVKIAEMVSYFPDRPIIAAFTATATEQVREDIIKLLGLHKPYITVSSFDRPNLFFGVERPQKRMDAMLQVLQRHQKEPGIIYCSTRKTTEQVCQVLRGKGFSASFYHGGLSASKRDEAQEDFVYDRIQIMVATNAFGMGIDKPNVRFVLHYNMPKNMESYYQEAGRAGRDGDPAECILFFGQQDILTNKMLIENGSEQPEPSAYRKLDQMKDYCHIDRCLRGFILEYFGQTPEFAEGNCHNCSNCNSTAQITDITIETQKILSCVKRMGERFGSSMVTDVLRGSRSQKIKSWGFEKLSTYGIMRDYSSAEVRELIAFLVSEGYLDSQGDKMPYLKLSPKAAPVLKGKESVSIRRAVRKKKENKSIESQNPELYRLLMEHCQELAINAGIPAYFIFSDANLRAMSNICPATLEEMLTVPGVGEFKLEKYGLSFLEIINQYRKTHPDLKVQPVVIKPSDTESSKPRRHTTEIIRDSSGNRVPSEDITFAFFQIGKSVEDIAEMRGISVTTVESHLLSKLMAGAPINYVFATPEQQALILDVWNKGYHTFRDINDHLPNPLRFCCIQYTLYKNHLQLERGRKEP